MTDKEKIIAYIDKLLEKYPKNYYLLTVAEFIDTLQEEPMSEDLEEVAHQNYKPNDTFMDGFKKGAQLQKQQDMKYGYITALQGEKQFARKILEMIANGWHIEAIKTACNDKIKEDEQ